MPSPVELIFFGWGVGLGLFGLLLGPVLAWSVGHAALTRHRNLSAQLQAELRRKAWEQQHLPGRR